MTWYKDDPIYTSNKREAGNAIKGIIILIAFAIISCGILGVLLGFKP